MKRLSTIVDMKRTQRGTSETISTRDTPNIVIRADDIHIHSSHTSTCSGCVVTRSSKRLLHRSDTTIQSSLNLHKFCHLYLRGFPFTLFRRRKYPANLFQNRSTVCRIFFQGKLFAVNDNPIR